MADGTKTRRVATTGGSIALLVIASVFTPWALWVSLWGGYGGSTGIVIAQWVVIILLLAGAGALSLERVEPIYTAFGLSEPVSPPERRSRMPIVVASVILVIAVLEGLVLGVNLSGGGHLHVVLAVVLAVLLGLSGLFFWLGLRRR